MHEVRVPLGTEACAAPVRRLRQPLVISEVFGIGDPAREPSADVAIDPLGQSLQGILPACSRSARFVHPIPHSNFDGSFQLRMLPHTRALESDRVRIS